MNHEILKSNVCANRHKLVKWKAWTSNVNESKHEDEKAMFK